MADKNHGEELSAVERELGLDTDITRRDFVNMVSMGAGASLLHAAAPGVARAATANATGAQASPDPWTGPAGVGDYVISNGNTLPVVTAGHGIRDSQYESKIANATPTGETYDVVVVGGGFSGAFAAYTVVKETQRKKSCLILENHPIIGGEAKRNEFIVNGQKLIGPQGANQCPIYYQYKGPDSWYSKMWQDVLPSGRPTDIEFAKLAAGRKQMEFLRDHYTFYAHDVSENYGFFFEEPDARWVTNMWGHRLEGTPYSDEMKRELLRWREEPAEKPFDGDKDTFERWLDTMTYEEFLTNVRGFHPEVASYANPFLAAAMGPAGDVMSAYLAWFLRGIAYGFDGMLKDDPRQIGKMDRRFGEHPGETFPGGCDGLMRLIVKWLNPEVIQGSTSLADVHNGKIHFEMMDRPGIPCRMRAGATAVHMLHDPEKRNEPAVITYIEGDKLYSVKARTVIWAAGTWSGKHAIKNLTPEYHAAADSFQRSPMMSVNVALNNWRALYKLGYTCCHWNKGFGFSGNLVEQMYIGDYRPPLDPDKPALFTMYVPFNQHGLSLADQCKGARYKIYATPYRDYEMQIRQQLTTLFGNAGFDAKRDIAGIIINRWGHAYIAAPPGFYFSRDGKPTASDTLRTPLGNLTFAHSELSGHQTHLHAGEEGVRAAHQALEML